MISSIRRTAVVVVLTAALSIATATLFAPAQAANATSDAARGKVYTGLSKADAGRCKGLGYYVTKHPEVCTHGPDTSPNGVDVRDRKSTSDLMAEGALARRDAGGPMTTAGATVGTSNAPTDGSGAIVCDGDGTTGPRTQVLYVRASDVASRFTQLADTIGSFMVSMDGIYNASAQETGGSRHVRFVTEPSAGGACQLSVKEVVVPTTGDDSFSNTITEVKKLGWDASVIGQPRKFLMMVDANVLCGIGQLYNDDRAEQTNYNNSIAGMYNRSDNGCWNYAEAHELMHNIGGVQNSAPHSTGAGHCFDEYDLECYADGGPTSTLQYLCASSSHDDRFDCNHDDYYSTNPPAGSYLATHWNTASSRFLINPGSATADTTPPAVPSGVTASASGSTVSVTWVSGTDADLAGYRVYRNGAQVASTGVTSSWSQSVADGTYTYSVAAVDATGNVSAQSAGSTVTVSTATGPVSKTESLTGKFTDTGTASVGRSAKAGSTSAQATSYAKARGKNQARPITIRVTDASGAVVATGSGTGNVTVTWTAPANGPLTWTLLGSSGATWTLKLTYWV